MKKTVACLMILTCLLLVRTAAPEASAQEPAWAIGDVELAGTIPSNGEAIHVAALRRFCSAGSTVLESRAYAFLDSAGTRLIASERRDGDD